MTYDHRFGDPEDTDFWEERFRQVQFLRSKLEWLREEILSEKEDFPDFVKEWAEEEGIEDNAYLHMLKELKKDNRGRELEDGYITEQVIIESVKHPLSYLIENYLIERKRVLEHGLKLIRDTVNPNKSDDKLSPQSFLRSLDEELNEDSWQYKILELDLDLHLFVIRNKDYFKDIIDKRTRLTHYQAENRKNIMVEFPMAEIENKTINRIDSGTPRDFRLELDGEDLEKFLEKDEEKLEKFFKTVQSAVNRYNSLERFLAIMSKKGEKEKD